MVSMILVEPGVASQPVRMGPPFPSPKSFSYYILDIELNRCGFLEFAPKSVPRCGWPCQLRFGQVSCLPTIVHTQRCADCLDEIVQSSLIVMCMWSVLRPAISFCSIIENRFFHALVLKICNSGLCCTLSCSAVVGVSRFGSTSLLVSVEWLLSRLVMVLHMAWEFMRHSYMHWFSLFHVCDGCNYLVVCLFDIAYQFSSNGI